MLGCDPACTVKFWPAEDGNEQPWPETLWSIHWLKKKKKWWANKQNPTNILVTISLPPFFCFLILIFPLPRFLLCCPIFWPLSAICASATFGTSPPTGTCAKPGNPNQDARLGSVQLTRLGNCTLTLIFMAGPLFIPGLCVSCLMNFCRVWLPPIGLFWVFI